MDESGGKVIWILAGCTGLLTVLLCVGGGIALFLVTGSDDGGDPFAFGPTDPQPFGPVPAPTPIPGPMAGPVDLSSRRVVATVTSGTGAVPVAFGTECAFDVEGVEQGGGAYWCNAQVYCGGRLLYGGPSSGFFPCTLYPQPVRHVLGADGDATSVDTDAAFSLDTAQGILSLRDDVAGAYGAYTLEARVTGVF